MNENASGAPPEFASTEETTAVIEFKIFEFKNDMQNAIRVPTAKAMEEEYNETNTEFSRACARFPSVIAS